VPKCENVHLNLGLAFKLELSLCEKDNGTFLKDSQEKKYRNESNSNSILDYCAQIDPFLVIDNLLDIFD